MRTKLAYRIPLLAKGTGSIFRAADGARPGNSGTLFGNSPSGPGTKQLGHIDLKNDWYPGESIAAVSRGIFQCFQSPAIRASESIPERRKSWTNYLHLRQPADYPVGAQVFVRAPGGRGVGPLVPLYTQGMVRVGRIAAYFALGSLAAGTVFGLGFAINFRGDISARDEERRRRLGPSERFDLGEIYGALTHHAQPSPTMVFVHGRSANWSEALPMAERFYAEGYNIVLWGRSGRAIHYADEGTRDVLRVVDHVRKHPAVDRNKIFVFGLSLGAALALGAAAGDDSSHIAGVIADSPYGNLRAAAFHYVTAFGHIPKLFAWPTAFVMFRVAEAVHSIEFTRCNPVDWARRI